MGKIITLDELAAVREKYRSAGKKVVWTNGCFDLMHEGHILSLKSAKALGDVLVVGLNSDESVKSLKGASRPICPQESRAAVLSSLEMVDHVVIFSGKRCTPELEAVHPDIYAQGAHYTLETIDQDERRAVEDGGGQIAFLPMQEGISTSAIIKRIRRNDPEKIVSAAFALIRNEQGKLLLVANKYVEGTRWGLPGGGHERWEKLADTIVRECREEVGLKVEIKRYRGVIERVEPATDLHLILHLYEVEVIGNGNPVPNASEGIIAASYFSIPEIENHPDWILGRKQFLDYLKSPESFPSYTYMGPGEE